MSRFSIGTVLFVSSFALAAAPQSQKPVKSVHSNVTGPVAPVKPVQPVKASDRQRLAEQALKAKREQLNRKRAAEIANGRQ